MNSTNSKMDSPVSAVVVNLYMEIFFKAGSWVQYRSQAT